MIIYVSAVQRQGGPLHFSVHSDKESAEATYEANYELMPLSVRASLALYEVDLDLARLLASETT